MGHYLQYLRTWRPLTFRQWMPPPAHPEPAPELYWFQAHPESANRDTQLDPRSIALMNASFVDHAWDCLETRQANDRVFGPHRFSKRSGQHLLLPLSRNSHLKKCRQASDVPRGDTICTAGHIEL